MIRRSETWRCGQHFALEVVLTRHTALVPWQRVVRRRAGLRHEARLLEEACAIPRHWRQACRSISTDWRIPALCVDLEQKAERNPPNHNIR
jgi:hypothetical protein